MPVDLEPVQHGIRDDPANAVDGGQLVARRRADRVERSEIVGQGARRNRADVADAQTDQKTPQLFRLGGVDVGDDVVRHLGGDVVGVARKVVSDECRVIHRIGPRARSLAQAPERGVDLHPQRDSVAREIRTTWFCVVDHLDQPGLVIAYNDLDREDVLETKREQARLGGQRRCRRMQRLGQSGRRDLADRLDVECPAGGDVLDATAHLGRAGARVGAAQIHVALLGGGQQGAALGTVGRHHELALGAVTQLDDRTQHLRDHVTGLAQHDRVTDEHALGFHDVLVVEGGLAHLTARHPHFLHDRERRRATGATDRDDDVEQLRVHLLGRVLVGDRPPWRPAGGAELLVQGQFVDLDHDAVDLVRHRVSMGTVVLDVRGSLLGGGDHLEVRAGGKAPTLQQLVGARLAGDRCTRVVARVWPRTDAVHQQLQATDAVVHPGEGIRALALFFLTQASGCRVPRVGEEPVPGGGLCGVQLTEGLHREVHLAAHLDHRRWRRRGESRRDGGDRAHVLGHVFADHAVAAGGRADQHAVDVAEIQRKAVDLQLAQVVDAPPGVTFHLRGPGHELLATEDVIEAQHPLGVNDRVEQAALGSTADRLGGAVLALQFGEQPLELFEAPHHAVVLVVADQQGIALVVGLAQFENPRRQFVGLDFGAREVGAGSGGELTEGVGGLRAARHGSSLGRTPDADAGGDATMKA